MGFLVPGSSKATMAKVKVMFLSAAVKTSITVATLVLLGHCVSGKDSSGASSGSCFSSFERSRFRCCVSANNLEIESVYLQATTPKRGSRPQDLGMHVHDTESLL